MESPLSKLINKEDFKLFMVKPVSKNKPGPKITAFHNMILSGQGAPERKNV